MALDVLGAPRFGGGCRAGDGDGCGGQQRREHDTHLNRPAHPALAPLLHPELVERFRRSFALSIRSAHHVDSDTPARGQLGCPENRRQFRPLSRVTARRRPAYLKA
jgi:hypothetical protein